MARRDDRSQGERATDDRWGEETAELLRETAEQAIDFLRSLPERPVRPRASLAEIRAAFDGPLPTRGLSPTDVLRRLAQAAEPGVMGTAGPRFFGFVIGGTLPAALAADWLTSAWDQNAHHYPASPASSVAEEVAAQWLLDLFDLPRESGGRCSEGRSARERRRDTTEPPEGSVQLVPVVDGQDLV